MMHNYSYYCHYCLLLSHVDGARLNKEEVSLLPRVLERDVFSRLVTYTGIDKEDKYLTIEELHNVLLAMGEHAQAQIVGLGKCY